MALQKENLSLNCSPPLQNRQENSLPFLSSTQINSACSKLNFHKLGAADNRKLNAPMHSSKHQSLIFRGITSLRVGISSKIWLVARCSTSHNKTWNETEQNEIDLSGFNSLEEEGDDLNANLPGLQIHRQDKAMVSRKLFANDMQVNQMIEEETGVQRLQAMYALGPDWMFIQEDTRTMTTIFYRSVLLGFLLNVVKATQKESKATKHMSATQATMKAGMSSMGNSTRIIKEAAKGSLRLTGFAGSLIYLSQSISAYRNQSSPWEYSISTAVAMAFAALGKPPKSFFLSISGGAVVGALGGSLICSMMSSAGASQEQRTLNRIRQQLEQQQQNMDFDNKIIR